MALTDDVRHPILGVFLIHYINPAVESPREFTHLAISDVLPLGFGIDITRVIWDKRTREN